MTYYRRSSTQERLEWARRRSNACVPSVSGPRRCSVAVPSVRFRSNSRANSDAFALDVIHPDLEDLNGMIPGLEEHLTFEPTPVALPPEEKDSEGQESDTEEEEINWNDEYVPPSEEEIHHVLSQMASKASCFSPCRTASNVTVLKVEYQPRYRYTLNSFTEKRHLSWSFEPYDGTKLDEPSNETIPDPWSVTCSCPKVFQNGTATVNIPHTDCLFTCCTCGGLGRKRCPVCNASGWKSCSFCLGDGHKIALHGQKEKCHSCLGIGTKKCWRCVNGMATCQGCGGTGQIRYFITLTVIWNNYTDTEISGETDDLRGKLQLAMGNIIFEEQLPEITPIKSFPDDSIIKISNHIVEKHKKIQATEKLLAQWQKYEVIPVSLVSYQVDRRTSHQCVIYGIENSIHILYSNRKCCCML